jgi:hypothetical protein
MAKRILPYRDYSEHEVVNAFSLDTESYKITGAIQGKAGDFDAGVVVAVKEGSLPGDMPEQDIDGDLRAYLGASYSAGSTHIGYSSYPYNGMTVEPATDGSDALGITLRETLAYDENGEKMLTYRVKLDEAQAVLPGHTVPVLTRGLILLHKDAFANMTGVSPGAKLTVQDGKFVQGTSNVVGTVVATGKESTSEEGAVDKVLCKISF